MSFPNNTGGYVRSKRKSFTPSYTAADFRQLLASAYNVSGPLVLREPNPPKPQSHKHVVLLGKRCIVRIADFRRVRNASAARGRIVADLSHGWRERSTPAEIAAVESYIKPKVAHA